MRCPVHLFPERRGSLDLAPSPSPHGRFRCHELLWRAARCRAETLAATVEVSACPLTMAKGRKKQGWEEADDEGLRVPSLLLPSL